MENDILSLSQCRCKYKGKIPNGLLHKCLFKSKALETSVSDLFVFDNLYVDGKNWIVNINFVFILNKRIVNIQTMEN